MTVKKLDTKIDLIIDLIASIHHIDTEGLRDLMNGKTVTDDKINALLTKKT